MPAHQGGGVIRSRLVAVLLLFGLACLPLVALAADPIVVLTPQGPRDVPASTRGTTEMVPLEAAIQGLGVTVRPDARKGSLTLSSGPRQVVLYQGRNLASVAGELRLLSAAPVLENGAWHVPIDSLPRLLGPLLDLRVEWRAPVRTLLVGNVVVPRLTLATSVAGDSARVVLEGSRRLVFRVTQEPGRVLVAVPAGALDVGFSLERLTGGVVDSVRFVGGRENVVEIATGARFARLETAEQENRLVLLFQAGSLPMASAAPTPPPHAGGPLPGTGGRVIVIDPGHGGEDLGAQGPGGTLEKEVALSVARRLRSSLANALGAQVFLTRDRDDTIGLDERTAIANNYKADVFISIHANASRAQSARGSEVYFLSAEATDDESRRIAMIESGEAEAASPVAPSSDLAMILWDMAQAAHLAESSVLASRVHEQLAAVTGSEGRGVKQAPFRVLVGAAMPAVLVELAFISNSAEEKLLASEAYQARVASALARGIARFLDEREGALRHGAGGR